MAYANLEEAIAAGAREIVASSDAPGWAWKTWPDALWTLTALESLTLVQGALYELPAEIAGLTNLRSLVIRGSIQRAAAGGLGRLSSLRSLAWDAPEILPPDVRDLRLDRLSIIGSWGHVLPEITTIPVRVNVTLLGDEQAADRLGFENLSAWRELQELELDAYPDFDTRTFERSLPRCGFAINRTGNRARDRA
ncbi:MAG: hypothetical protein AB7T06_20015 [Kofleriaceae bacterium]